MRRQTNCSALPLPLCNHHRTVLLSDLSVGLAPETLTEAGAEQQPLAPHDFLIRPLALDPSGVIAVGDFVRAGQRMRFMVRGV